MIGKYDKKGNRLPSKNLQKYSFTYASFLTIEHITITSDWNPAMDAQAQVCKALLVY